MKAEGLEVLEEALRRRTPGQYQTQAAIAAVHAEAADAENTDWDQIVGLYDVLLDMRPGPVVALNRAVAVAMRDGPEAGLVEADEVLRRRPVGGLPIPPCHQRRPVVSDGAGGGSGHRLRPRPRTQCQPGREAISGAATRRARVGRARCCFRGDTALSAALHHLEHPPTSRHATQFVLAEVDEAEPRPGCQVSRCARDHYPLPRLTEEPGAMWTASPDRSSSVSFHLPGVDRRPHGETIPLQPVPKPEGGVDGGRRDVECGKDSIAGRPNDGAAVLGYQALRRRMVLAEHLLPGGIAQPGCPLGRRDEVGEEDRGQPAPGSGGNKPIVLLRPRGLLTRLAPQLVADLGQQHHLV